MLKASGQGQGQGRQQDAELPRSFVFNELSLEEIKLVESTLVSIHPAIIIYCLLDAVGSFDGILRTPWPMTQGRADASRCGRRLVLQA